MLSPQYNYSPTVRWCGIPVTRLWRCGNRGSVASALIEKPARGDFLAVLDGGYSLQYSPLLEYHEGKGMVLFCQMDVTGRTQADPAAETLARNILTHVANWKPAPRRQAVYVGDQNESSLCWRWLSRAGLLAGPDVRADALLTGGNLSVGHVLIVGPGGAATHAGQQPALARWLQAGGNLLALGLDARQANTFLPFKVKAETKEHIATCFEPFGRDSLLAGIGPADAHRRSPQQLPLLTGGVNVIGDGVLAKAKEANVVFCQLAPVAVEGQHNLKQTFRRSSYLLTRLLANMGVAAATPLLEHFSHPLAKQTGDSLIKNGSFNNDADDDGVADEWLFSCGVRQASAGREQNDNSDSGWAQILVCPAGKGDGRSSAMLAQHHVPVKRGQWYRISLRARAERLQAKTVTVTLTNMATWRSFFEYQRFEPGPHWQQFAFDVQANDTAKSNTRFQIWYTGAGELWLSDIRLQPLADPAKGRWLDGLYLDTPEEWDDPYRFFRW